MYPEDLPRNFDRLGLTYVLGAPATAEELAVTEARLGRCLPASLARFYQVTNGLQIAAPAVSVEPLAGLASNLAGLVYFATVDGEQRLYLDPEAGREGEWLVQSDAGYVVTRSVASFWANTLWHWLRHRRPIWRDWRTEEFGAHPNLAHDQEA